MKIIIGAVMAMLLLAGCGEQTPKDFSENYIKAVKTGDINKMLYLSEGEEFKKLFNKIRLANYLCADDKKELNKEKCASKKVTSDFGEDIKYISSKKEGNKGEVILENNKNKKIKLNIIRKKDNKWKVISIKIKEVK